ncbi:hypothetical protein A6A27_31765 [Micromonospora sp. CB01531]|nr:hypothetical protein A6A27_31765 [Micromonospora sp. CB01531]
MDALDWAAAQASVKGADLHIVHTCQPRSVLGQFALAGIELVAIGAAESVHDAAERACSIAPELAVTTQIAPGPPSARAPAACSPGDPPLRRPRHIRGVLSMLLPIREPGAVCSRSIQPLPRPSKRES